MEKSKKELLTRVISSLLGFPLVVIIFIFANDIVFGIASAMLSIICLYEYYNGFRVNKKANPSGWLGYLFTAILLIINLLRINGYPMMSDNGIWTFVIGAFIFSLLLLTIELIINNGKKTIIDMTVTMFGILYIPVMLFFLNLIHSLDMGKIFIWYAIIPAWGSDIFAYLLGRKIGKHKFTQISPNKTLEGCASGILGAMIIGLIYTFCINNIFSMNINYIAIAIATVMLALIGQIGDLAESSIKRYCEIKDCGTLIPGHGGMLDRFDSVIFVLPFAYIFIKVFIPNI